MIIKKLKLKRRLDSRYEKAFLISFIDSDNVQKKLALI